MKSILFAIACILGYFNNLAHAEAVDAYAKACDALIGQSVPTFNCDQGELVPETHANHPDSYGLSDSKCDRPNQLNRQCDPGSRFQVLFNNDKAYAVAHCRKKGGGSPVGVSVFQTAKRGVWNSNDKLIKFSLKKAKDSLYGDVAVIQHSKINGVTCFYQSPVSQNGAGMVDGSQVPAPSSFKGPAAGAHAFSWNPPTSSCVSCHDAGPLIRSPYLAQLKGQVSKGKDRLPWLLANGDRDFEFNSKDHPYNFTGQEFTATKVFKLEAGNSCTTCHNMGTGQSSLDFGLRATEVTIVATKNPDSAASPLWMPYDHPSSVDLVAQKEAQGMRDCADAVNNNKPKPDGCSVTLHGKFYKSNLIQFPGDLNFPKNQIPTIPVAVH